MNKILAKRRIICIYITAVMMICAAVMGCQKNDNAVKLKSVLDNLTLTSQIKSDIMASPKVFLADLMSVLADDTNDLLILADKKHVLPSGYIPSDLVPVEDTGYMKTNRSGHLLRRPVCDGLKIMCEAAKADGYTMLISSTYRSYQYQEGLYNHYLKIYGPEATSRFSAKPGTSQHQLGAVIDFGNVDDSFADTGESKWLEANAAKFGFALSFPLGYEEVTGFKWECWQYRYVGHSAIALQQKWFGNINQYMLEFIDMWRRSQ